MSCLQFLSLIFSLNHTKQIFASITVWNCPGQVHQWAPRFQTQWSNTGPHLIDLLAAHDRGDHSLLFETLFLLGFQVTTLSSSFPVATHSQALDYSSSSTQSLNAGCLGLSLVLGPLLGPHSPLWWPHPGSQLYEWMTLKFMSKVGPCPWLPNLYIPLPLKLYLNIFKTDLVTIISFFKKYLSPLVVFN